MTFVESMRRQREIGEEILQQSVIPRIVRPLAQVIASKRARLRCSRRAAPLSDSASLTVGTFDNASHRVFHSRRNESL